MVWSPYNQRPRLQPAKLIIAVIGAGIGRLTAAACLSRDGINLRVYDQARALTRLGAGIQQAPNTIRVLCARGLKNKMQA